MTGVCLMPYPIMILCRKELKNAWRLRKVIWFSATQRSSTRFARTKLGSLWLGISAAITTALLALVYGTIFKQSDFNSYIVQLGLGLILWNSIASPISASPSILEKNSAHINNINTQHIFYFFEEWIFNLQTFFQSFSLVFIFLCFFKPEMIGNLFFYFIPTLINFVLAMFWIPSLICFMGLWIKDLYQLIPSVLQLLFLLTPILYDKSVLGKASIVADLNLIFRYMSPLRESLISNNINIVDTLNLFILNIVGILLVLNCIRLNKKNIPFLI